MTVPTDDRRLLTAEEVGQLLRLRRSTVYQAAEEGRIPCVRLWRGRRKSVVRFRASDIEALIRCGGCPPPGREP